MASLKDKIRAMIVAEGPISISDYFAMCLADPEHGYYKTRDPFGREGDFVTAPEISQLFGEMIGIFLIHAWQAHGQPPAIRLVEIGPGRGTMMADMLRVIARLAPDMLAALSIHMVETSPMLRLIQANTLHAHSERVFWHDSFGDIPPGFLLIVGNEFFDAVPIRQFVKTDNGFKERMVGLDGEGQLCFTIGLAGIDADYLPPGHRNAAEGTIAELAPARNSILAMISEQLRTQTGTALFIDYGHLEPGFGDTLQAVLRHTFDPPLAHPGDADLTSHVDFASLALTAKSVGVHINGMMTQGDFLLGLGLLERAGQLGANLDDAKRAELTLAVHRLAGPGPDEMGSLFKVLAISSPNVSLLPFEDAADGPA